MVATFEGIHYPSTEDISGIVLPSVLDNRFIIRHQVKDWPRTDNVSGVNKAFSQPAYSLPTHGTITAFRSDTTITRKSDGAHISRRHKTAKRGNITGASKASRRRLRDLVFNLQPMRALVVLTYPDSFPVDGTKAKRDLGVLCKWLVRQEINYLWVLEFQSKTGKPHFNLLLTSMVDKEALKAKWAQVVGSGNAEHAVVGARVEYIRNQFALASYLCRGEQKAVPEGFTNVGKFWGKSRNLKVQKRAEYDGPLATMAPILRTARRWENARRRTKRSELLRQGKRVPRWLKPIRDNGRYSFRIRGSGPVIAAYLPRLQALFADRTSPSVPIVCSPANRMDSPVSHAAVVASALVAQAGAVPDLPPQNPNPLGMLQWQQITLFDVSNHVAGPESHRLVFR